MSGPPGKKLPLLLPLAISAASAVVGCGAATTRGATTTTLSMEPVRVTASHGDEGDVVVEAYDARDLLDRGNAALAEERYDAAIEHYDRLVAEFGDSALATAAHYNAALALERSGRLGAAARRYEVIADRHPDSEDVPDALFQAARCHERLEAWDAATATLERLLDLEDISPEERLEGMARRGTALVQGGHLEEGERQLRQAVAYARRVGEEAVRTDYYLAQAQYYLGEVPRRRMQQVELSPDEVRFRLALIERCELLLRAQTQYVQAIRVGNAHWAAASAYRIGEMYSSLYADVLDVPVPDPEIPADITDPADIEAFRAEYPRHYRRILRDYLRPLLQNAIRWWETNLMMVERTGVQGEWVTRTRAELLRVRGLLDEIQAEAEAGDAEPEEPPPAEADPASETPEEPSTTRNEPAFERVDRMATFLLDTSEANG